MNSVLNCLFFHILVREFLENEKIGLKPKMSQFLGGEEIMSFVYDIDLHKNHHLNKINIC
jgi:hypothetical protein